MNEAKLWFWILLDAALVVLVVLGVCFVMPAFVRYSESLAPARMLTVSAQGKTEATPDLAVVTFSVLSQGANPQVLASNNTDKMNAVLQFVASQNIATSDIATTGYSLQPNYQYDKNTQRNYITGYTLTNTVTLKIHDLSNVATVLGGLAPLGVNQIGGVNFTFNDPDQFVALARADAMNLAKQKADQMASEAGVSLGEPVNINESYFVPQPYAYTMAYGMGGGAADSASTPNIQPGTQEVTDNVTVTYQLR